MPIARRRVTPVALLLAAVAATILVPGSIQLSTDWLWFREIGYGGVFRTEVLTRLGLFWGVGALAFAMLYGNLRLCQRGLVPDPVVVRLSPAAPRIDVTGGLRRLALPVALVLALLIALSTTGLWLDLLAFGGRVPFGTADPVFGRDVGYYVFTLPVLAHALGLAQLLVVLTLLLCIPVYWLRGDIIIAPRHVRVEPSAQLHLGVLLAVAFLIAALLLWFVRVPELLFSTRGPLVGASYTDLAVRRPALRVQALVALGAAAFVLAGALRRRVVWHAALAGLAYVAVAVVGGVLAPAFVQRLIVAPNELSKEAPQLEHHIAATRRAWGLDRVVTRDLPGESALTLADLRANGATLDNVRLWDHAPLLQTFGQLQEIRTYYDFVSVDDDRYWLDGKYRQVLLSPRELNPASLPQRTWINQHLTFTHGMGLTLGPVNQVTPEGLPVLFVQDLPPSSTGALRVTRPQIYYGELTDDYVVVRTAQREFDYPAGDANVFSEYAGRGGVEIGGALRRSLLALRFGSLKLFLSSDIKATSRVLYRRNITERARTALPFLRFDSDPYMVVDSAGTLQWMLDAYTSSDRYPYARGLADGTNYLRNSAKVVIDAYHGTVTAFVADSADPIIRAYANAFPGILRPLSAMPGDLRAHVRYPENLYQAQTELYRVFHMDDAEALYHREDEWQIPQIPQEGEEADLFMRRIIMRLPEEQRAEFIFMTPFTPRNKDNLAAWMVARSDGDRYGELIVYRFPKQSLVFGPRQVVNRINQDTEISRQFALWDQRGSEVIRGELLVLPIEEALLYVQSVYLRAEGGRIPELKRVVVAYRNGVVMEETLDAALERLFGGRVTGGAPDASPDSSVAARDSAAAPAAGPPEGAVTAREALVRSALQHYERAVAAQRAGDWATYGVELERLGALLRRIAETPRP